MSQLPTLKHISSLLVLAVLVSSCAAAGGKIEPEAMYVHASALTKLSTAMESHIRYGHPLASQTDEELLAEGTKQNPALLANLSNYKLRVSRDNRHAVVLMCTQAGDRALLEDAGCTGKMDAHHWKQEKVPCEFSLSAATICEGVNK